MEPFSNFQYVTALYTLPDRNPAPPTRMSHKLSDRLYSINLKYKRKWHSPQILIYALEHTLRLQQPTMQQNEKYSNKVTTGSYKYTAM